MEISENVKIQFYQDVFDDLIEGCQIITPEWTYFYVNNTITSQARKSKEDLIGKKMSEVFPGIDKTPMFDVLRACMESRLCDKMINEFIFPDGEKEWFDLSFEPVPEGVLIISMEITWFKKAEKQINKINRLYNLHRNANQCIVRLRNTFDILRKVCQLAVAEGEFKMAWIGFLDENTGNVIEHSYAGPRRETEEKIVIAPGNPHFGQNPTIPALTESLPKVCNEVGGYSLKYIWKAEEEQKGHFSIGAFPLKLFEKSVGVLVLFADVPYFFGEEEIKILDELAMDLSFALEFSENEKKQLKILVENQQLTDHMNKSQRLESMGLLAGGIAHDFNNLLSGIFGYIDLAKMSAEDNKEAAEFLDEALNVMSRATALSTQLMTFSKGELPIRKTASLKPVIENSVNFALSGSNVLVEFRIDDNLALCDFDENQVAQVIDNIVINAKQAMPDGGKLLVSAENTELGSFHPVQKASRFVKISFTDTGSGIPEENLQHIFDPFFTTKKMGNGIGLATCFSIVKKHNGYIDVQSEPGETTFNVFLPASQKEVDRKVSSDESGHQGTGRILVMDDQEYICKILSGILKKMGYTVTTANDGIEAIKLFTEGETNGVPFDMVILDLTVPGGMGGRETIAEIRKLNKKVPVFAASGYRENQEISNPVRFGFTDSLQKPFKVRDLIEIMNRYAIK
jgi:signal transduction histidine kinase/ActR/RegA family two-component response regulator